MAIVDDILKQLDDDASVPVGYSRSEVLAALNEGQRLYCLLTLAYELRATISADAVTLVRTLVPDYLAPLRLQDAAGRIRPGTLADLDALSSTWRTDTASAPTRYASAGANLLLFWKGITAHAVELTYAAEPPTLTDGASPVITDVDWPALYHFARYRLRFKHGGQELQKSLDLFDQFMGVVKARANEVRARSVGVGYDTLPIELQRYDVSRMKRQFRADG
jgi:hypothetical protein